MSDELSGMVEEGAIKNLAAKGVSVCPFGLQFDPDVDFQGWIATGKILEEIEEHGALWFSMVWGDWWNYGSKWGRRADEIAKTKQNYETIKTYGWLWDKFPHNIRTFNLSIKQYRDLAPEAISERRAYTQMADTPSVPRCTVAAMIKDLVQQRKYEAAQNILTGGGPAQEDAPHVAETTKDVAVPPATKDGAVFAALAAPVKEKLERILAEEGQLSVSEFLTEVVVNHPLGDPPTLSADGAVLLDAQAAHKTDFRKLADLAKVSWDTKAKLTKLVNKTRQPERLILEAMVEEHFEKAGLA